MRVAAQNLRKMDISFAPLVSRVLHAKNPLPSRHHDKKERSSDEVLGRFILFGSTAVFVWIVLQFLLYKIAVPEFLAIILGVLIIFNMIWFFLLSAFLLISVYFVFNDTPRGIPSLIFNMTSSLLFFNADDVLQALQQLLLVGESGD